MPSTEHEIVVSPTTPMPEGYILVRKGNVYLTSNCRKKTHEAGEQLYAVQTRSNKTIGIRVPRTIFSSVLESHRETKSARIEAVAKKDARLNDKAEAQVLESFPNIPHDLIQEILSHTLKKRSGRVGRTATIPFEQSIDLAVRAFIRHNLTDYDQLLHDGMNQTAAREKIRGKGENIVEEWSRQSKERPQKRNASKPRSKTEKKPQMKEVETTSTGNESRISVEVIDLTND